jgi:hypothetical protein
MHPLQDLLFTHPAPLHPHLLTLPDYPHPNPNPQHHLPPLVSELKSPQTHAQYPCCAPVPAEEGRSDGRSGAEVEGEREGEGGAADAGCEVGG